MDLLIKKFRPYTRLSTPVFSLANTNSYARLVDLYDGDTITVVLPIAENNYYKFACRVNGIDTPELRSTDPQAKALGIKARDRMIELCIGRKVPEGDEKSKKQWIKEQLTTAVQLVYVECEGMDKYGRVLLKVRKSKEDPMSFGDILLHEGLAYEYGGGTKLTEEDQIKTLYQEL